MNKSYRLLASSHSLSQAWGAVVRSAPTTWVDLGQVGHVLRSGVCLGWMWECGCRRGRDQGIVTTVTRETGRPRVVSARLWCHVSWRGLSGQREASCQGGPGAAGLKGSVGRKSARQPASETETGVSQMHRKTPFTCLSWPVFCPYKAHSTAETPSPTPLSSHKEKFITDRHALSSYNSDV